MCKLERHTSDMKTKKLATLEKYTSVAVRSKISVEVEQRKRLGAWGKRVLVLDGATLYAYKTKGDGGSVGGWAIGGADVHVRSSNDSNRDDGRHILVIARPPAYKLVFAFSTVYEQARMIQALASSGATVTGLDAIMLFKNLRQQQEQEQKEQEQKQREQNAQKSQEKQEEAVAVNAVEEGGDMLANDDQPLEKDRNGKLEVEEIDVSIYNQGTATVTNPLYFSSLHFSKDKTKEDQSHGAGSSTLCTSISTSRDSDTEASHPQVLPANQDADDKVNPLPKPPRASVSEGSPTIISSVPDNINKGKNVNNTEASVKQSALKSEQVHEDLSRDALINHQGSSRYNPNHANPSNEFGEVNESGEVTLSEAKNDSDEDTEEGLGQYEFHPNPPDGQCPQSDITDKDAAEDSERDEGNFENNYIELVSKMKLERGLSIESQSGGPFLEAGSPEGIRKILGDSPLSDEVSIKTQSPVHEVGSDKDATTEGYSAAKEQGSNEQVSDKPVVSSDVLSDNDEKFEQLYRELSSNGTTDEVKSTEKTDASKVIENGDVIAKQEEILTNDSLTLDKKAKELPNGMGQEQPEVNKEQTNNEKNAEIEEKSPAGTPLKRVSSIIKKKDSPSTGKAKKVQFNLDATTIESGSHPKPHLSPKNEREDASSKTTSFKKAKKEPISPPPQESSPKKKWGETGTSPGTTPSPTKKKGIFSNIFSSATSKKPVDATPTKAEPERKKDPLPTKVDTNINKAPPTSQTNLKRQPTVDLTAPLIIGGSVEMGGSVSGKVSPRRIEVRDGHVLAFMPKATSPTSRLSLVGLSVAPLMGGVHANSLSLTRASRCMMVIKLTSRDEMMRWINVLSDEVIQLTPENQRTGLVLYPSPKKETSETKVKESEHDELKRPLQSNNSKELKDTMVPKRSQEILIGKQTKPELSNGHTEEHSDKTGVNISTKVEKVSSAPSNGEVIANGDTEVVTDEDASDGWFRKNKEPVVEEFEMDELEKPTVKSNEAKKVLTNKVHDTKTKTNRQSNGLKVVEEHFKEDQESEKTVRKIKKLNIEERWKEHKDNKNKGDSPVHRRSLENRHHQPLKRLSAPEKIISKPKSSEGQDTMGSLLFVNNPPKHDYHANCHPPLERLSNRSRILSASESNLRKGWDQKPASNINHLHRYGSELMLVEKPKKEFNNNMVSGTKDTSNVLVSSRIIRNQVNASKTQNEQRRMNGISPTSSPSHNRYKRSSVEPREVEIIESKRSSSQDLTKIGTDESNEEDDQWYDDDEANENHQEPSNGNSNSPGITWSVAATREKFELLCSVSGENKSGKLTTKTPISRKKSVRTSVKKRRSLEGGSGRRPNSRRNVRRNNFDDTSSPSKQSPTGTQFSPKFTSTIQNINENNVMTTPEKPYDSDTPSRIDQDTFKLQPVRDRRKTFEKDVTDSLKSSLYNSSSVDSVNDTTAINNRVSNVATSNEPSSPIKSPLRRTHNILQATPSPSSSPEPGFISSKLINSRPKGNIPNQDQGIVSRSLANEIQMDAGKDGEVVICWRGPYIAQESELGQNTDKNAVIPKRDRKDLKEAEQAVLSNISNAFLAKRRLLAREVAVARIQEKLSGLEETIWDLQASMAELDKQSSFTNAKTTNTWKTLERSLRTAEEDLAYWTSRLSQTQKEADQAREKLAAALVMGLTTQYNSDGEQIPKRHRQQLLKKYTGGRPLNGDDDVDDEDGEGEGEDLLYSEGENQDSFA